MPSPTPQPTDGRQMPALASPNPLAVERRVLRTRLSPAECIARLEAVTVGVGGHADKWTDGEWSLRGTVGRDGFFVRRFTRDMRNVGRPFVSGILEADGTGTRIWLTFAPQIAFRIFSVFAIVGVVAFAVYSVVTGYIGDTVPINGGESYLPVPWLIVILIAFLVVGPWVLKRITAFEGPWLLDFLMTALEARLDSGSDQIVKKKRRSSHDRHP